MNAITSIDLAMVMFWNMAVLALKKGDPLLLLANGVSLLGHAFRWDDVHI